MKTTFKKEGFVSKILILLLLFWVGFSLIRTCYNFSKLITEEKKWYFLTDEQKRGLQFGDMHFFFRFVQKNTEAGSNILFFTDDAKVYFLSRYYLYPTLRYGKFDKYLWEMKNVSYNYYIIYPANHSQLIREAAARPDIKDYKKIATYHGSSGEIGLLYKK